MSTGNELAAAAREVVKWWRHWSPTRRDHVRGLSPRLADALDDLVAVVEAGPRRGECATCGRVMQLTKDGLLRHHNGDVYVDGWRQMCAGTGKPPAVAP